MKTKIYLAGGMRTNWQKSVKDSLDLIFFDPSFNDKKRSKSLLEFSTWDLTRIKQSDIIFAYIERTNPGIIGTACEIGYGKGLGKTVILVLEKNNNYIKDKYLDFMKACSDIVYTNLDEAIQYLRNFEQ